MVHGRSRKPHLIHTTDRLVHMQTLHPFRVLQVKYLGGFDGAITLAKYSWFPWFPRITSATVLMVSVRMSAGTPLAIRMLQRVSSNPHAFIVFCEDIVTSAGLPGVTSVLTTWGVTSVLTTCNTKQRTIISCHHL